jgi:hypothetical protein
VLLLFEESLDRLDLVLLVDSLPRNLLLRLRDLARAVGVCEAVLLDAYCFGTVR